MTLFVTSLFSSQAPAASIAANLNWIGGKPFTIHVVAGSSTMTGDFTIQYTLDDIQRSSSPSWFNLSSNPFNQIETSPSVGVHWLSSNTAFPDGFMVNFPTPVCAVRMNSTAMSSSFMTFRVVQGEGW